MLVRRQQQWKLNTVKAERQVICEFFHKVAGQGGQRFQPAWAKGGKRDAGSLQRTMLIRLLAKFRSLKRSALVLGRRNVPGITAIAAPEDGRTPFGKQPDKHTTNKIHVNFVQITLQ